MIRHGAFKLLAMTFLLGLANVASAQMAVDAALPTYFRTNQPLKGKLTLVGSDTMSSVASIWAANFQKMYPDVQIDIQVKGAVNAVGAVMNGEAAFGLLSRNITLEEVTAFKQKFGYDPHVLTPALESIAVYVHKDNPIQSLTLAQLDAIFSTSLKRQAPKPIRTWGDLGATGNWANQPIVCHGRSATTGSQVYFQAVVTGNGEFRPDMIANANNLDLVKAIAADPRAIGFAGSIYELPQVKDVAIAYTEQHPPIAVLTPGYPLVRPLQLVVNKSPNAQLPPIESEFLKYIFSRSGQEDVVIGGFQAIQAKPAEIAIQSVGLNSLN